MTILSKLFLNASKSLKMYLVLQTHGFSHFRVVCNPTFVKNKLVLIEFLRHIQNFQNFYLKKSLFDKLSPKNNYCVFYE